MCHSAHSYIYYIPIWADLDPPGRGGPPGGVRDPPSEEEFDPQSADLGVWGLRFCFAGDCFSQNPRLGSIWAILDPPLGGVPGGPWGPSRGGLGPPLRPPKPRIRGLGGLGDPPLLGGSLGVGFGTPGAPKSSKKLRWSNAEGGRKIVFFSIATRDSTRSV